ELIGKIDFIDMVMLAILGRVGSAAEKDMLNAILVTVTDHGLTPSALAARLTYTGAPEALQGAVAAGLLGAGSVYLGAMQDAADMLNECVASFAEASVEDEDAIRDGAARFVDARRAARRPLSGVGHHIHLDG